MDGRSYAILASLALAAVAFTGCIAPGLTLNNAELERTALDARGPAEAAAQAWAPGAQLVAIFALESLEENPPLPADVTPGNGRAPAWNFAYRAPDGTPRAFLSLADGTVITPNETFGAEAHADQATPLTNLNVDSADALETAAMDATFAEALRGQNLTLAEGAAHWEGATAWYFAAMSDAGAAIAVVDAGTGELLWARSFGLGSMDFTPFAQAGFAYRPMPEPLHVEKEGRLDRNAHRESIDFALNGFSDEGLLRIVIQKDLPTDGLSWRIVKVEGEDEEEIDAGRMGSAGARTAEEREFDLELDGPGQYRLDLSYRSLTLVGVGGLKYQLTLDVGALPDVDADTR